MDAETLRWLFEGGFAFAVFLNALQWRESRRNGKNIHKLRNQVQKIVMTLATRGITINLRDEDDDG